MTRTALMNGLVCPECFSELSLSDQGKYEPSPHLTCERCVKHYAIADGVPYFAEHLNQQSRTANTFGFAWKAFWKGRFDTESVFGLKMAETTQYFLESMGVSRDDLRSSIVLDAGTGSGRVPMSLSDCSCSIYAVDIHNELSVVAKLINSDSAAVIQADLMKLPFNDGYFDYVWSSGVIHHTPDTERAFESLAKKVAPGGRMFVSVYGKMLHHYRLFRHILPFSPRLPPTVNYGLAAILAIPLYLAFNSILLVLRLLRGNKPPPYHVFGFGIDNVEHKSYFSIVLNLFDQLHPKYQHEHTVEEVKSWFEKNGFQDIVVTQQVGMVEMRGIKIDTTTK